MLFGCLLLLFILLLLGIIIIIIIIIATICMMKYRFSKEQSSTIVVRNRLRHQCRRRIDSHQPNSLAHIGHTPRHVTVV